VSDPFQLVCARWKRACTERNRYLPAFESALHAFAVDARCHGMLASDVLRRLSDTMDPWLGGDPTLDCHGTRVHAGTVAITGFYARLEAAPPI
jgi:hypothetical protein